MGREFAGLQKCATISGGSETQSSSRLGRTLSLYRAEHPCVANIKTIYGFDVGQKKNDPVNDRC